MAELPEDWSLEVQRKLEAEYGLPSIDLNDISGLIETLDELPEAQAEAIWKTYQLLIDVCRKVVDQLRAEGEDASAIYLSGLIQNWELSVEHLIAQAEEE